MSPIRKQVLFRTLFIVFIVIPVVVFRTENYYLKTLKIVIIFYGYYQLMMLILQLQQFFDDVWPPKLSKNAIKEKSHKFFFYGSQVLFYVGVFFHLGICWWTKDTIFVEKLILLSTLVGFVISLVVTFIIVWKKPSVYHESTRRLTVHFGIIFGISLFVSAFTIFINHLFADSIVSCKTYTIDEKSKFGRYDVPCIYVAIENKKEKIYVNANLFSSLEEGGHVNICSRKGLLGYEIVYEIRKLD